MTRVDRVRLSEPAREFSKRVLDLSVSLLVIILFLPLLVLVSVLVRLDSPGPVFYRGERIGRFGRTFFMFKFRTMVADADRIGPSSTAGDDSRVTRIGAFLRAWKIDEVPQFFNVLLGEMSCVGPRPQVRWAVDLYTPDERELLLVRPGITDWASIRFSNEGEILKGSDDPDRDYMEKIHPEKIRLGLKYVRQQSMKTDLKILFSTFKAVLSNGK